MLSMMDHGIYDLTHFFRCFFLVDDASPLIWHCALEHRGDLGD